MRNKVLILLVLLFSTGKIDATQSRLLGMGVDNWMVADDYNVWLNPAELVHYSNRVWIDLGVPPVPTAVTQWAGVSWQGKESDPVIGLFINRPYSGITSIVGSNAPGSDSTPIPNSIIPGISGAAGFNGNLTFLVPDNKIDLFIAGGPSTSLYGIMLNIANNIETRNISTNSDPRANNDGTAENIRESTELNLSLGWVPDKLLFFGPTDCTIQIGYPAVNNKYTEKRYLSAQARDATDSREFKITNPLTYTLLFRPELVLNETNRFYSILKYTSAQVPNVYTDRRDANADGALDTNTKQDRNQTVSNLLFGTAGNINITPQTTLIYGVSLDLNMFTNREKLVNDLNGTTTQEYSYDYLIGSVPFNIALEYQVYDKFTLRTGVERVLYQYEETKISDPDWQTVPTNQITNTFRNTTVRHSAGTFVTSLGLTFIPWERFTIEAVVTQNLLFSGTYILSGQVDFLFARLTLLYHFGG